MKTVLIILLIVCTTLADNNFFQIEVDQKTNATLGNEVLYYEESSCRGRYRRFFPGCDIRSADIEFGGRRGYRSLGFRRFNRAIEVTAYEEADCRGSSRRAVPDVEVGKCYFNREIRYILIINGREKYETVSAR